MRIALLIKSLLLVTLPVGVSGFAQAVSVSVPGTANPYLAGVPDGSTASPDQAPYQSPIEVNGLNLSAGGALTFRALYIPSSSSAFIPQRLSPPSWIKRIFVWLTGKYFLQHC